MKNKNNYFIFLATLLLVVIVFSVLSPDKIKDEKTLEIGLYNTKDHMAWLELKENNKFELSRNMATSYNPTGDYSIVSDRLILNVDDLKNSIEFLIIDDALSFDSGKLAENLIEKGEIFTYQAEKYDYMPMISIKDYLYLITDVKKSTLTDEWFEFSEIRQVTSSTAPIKTGQNYYVANDFQVGCKIYTRKQNYEVLYVLYENQFYEYIRQQSEVNLSKDQKIVEAYKSSIKSINIESQSTPLGQSRVEFIKTYGQPLKEELEYNVYLESNTYTLSYDFCKAEFISSFTEENKEILTYIKLLSPEIMGPHGLEVGHGMTRIFKYFPKINYGDAYINSILTDAGLNSFKDNEKETISMIYLSEDASDIGYIVYNEFGEVISVEYILNWESGGYTRFRFNVENRIIINMLLESGFM